MMLNILSSLKMIPHLVKLASSDVSKKETITLLIIQVYILSNIPNL
jgi:hypothetical protein